MEIFVAMSGSKEIALIWVGVLIAALGVVVVILAAALMAARSPNGPTANDTFAVSASPSPPRARPPQSTEASGDEWYAIAAGVDSEAVAKQYASKLGSAWAVIASSACPNFTPGLYVVVKGPFMTARAAREALADVKGYEKRCR